MSKEILGHITCPHCGNTSATVHEQASKRKKLYYRCNPGETDGCGTVQIPFDAGQAFIKNNLRPLSPLAAHQAAEQAADDARERQNKAAKVAPGSLNETKPASKKGAFFAAFLSDEV